MKRPVRPRGVVFDLDGTLVDSLTLVLGALTHALEPFGGRPTMDIFGQLGGPPQTFLGRMLPSDSDVPAALQRFRNYHEANSHRILPYAGAADHLASLQEGGMKLAVWTGRDRGSTEWLLQRHGLDRYFSAVLCGDDLDSHKPDPAGLRAILGRLELLPEEIILVGDADVDVLGGAACGVDTLLIRHGREIPNEITARCWRMVASPNEAYVVVAEHLQRPDGR
jgi:HAD superfamily hydrolase (TIGR01549 family)